MSWWELLYKDPNSKKVMSDIDKSVAKMINPQLPILDNYDVIQTDGISNLPSSLVIVPLDIYDPNSNHRADSLTSSLTGKAVPTATLSQYNDWAKQAAEDGKFTRSEWKTAVGMLGLNKARAKAFRRAVKQGLDTSSYRDNLSKKYYIKDGKLFLEGTADYNERDFLAVGAGQAYYGNDPTAFAEKYNKSILDWRNTEGDDFIRYDAVTGKFYAKGFNEGPEVDVTNSEWAKAKNEAARKAWFDANKNKLTYDNGSVMFDGVALKDSSWMDQNFVNKLSANDFYDDVDEYRKNNTYNTLTDFDKYKNLEELNKTLGFTTPESRKAKDYAELYRQKLDEALQNYTRDNGAVKGTALYNYLKTNNLLHVGKGEDVTLNAAHPYMQALNLRSPINKESEQYAFMKHKNGGNLNIRKVRAAYKKGGLIQYAGFGDILWGAADYIPIAGTAKKAYLAWNGLDGVTWGDVALSGALDAFSIIPGGAFIRGAGTLARGAKGLYYGRKLTLAGKVINRSKGAKSAYGQIRNLQKDRFIKMKNFLKQASTHGAGSNEANAALAELKQAEKNLQLANKTWGRQASLEKKILEKEMQTARNANGKLATFKGEKASAKELAAAEKALYGSRWKKPSTYFTIFGKRDLIGVPIERSVVALRNGLAESPKEEVDTQTYIPADTSEYIQQSYPGIAAPTETSNFQITGTDWYYKQGGNLNMHNINYFLAGGAMASQAASAAAPSQGGQDMQTQVAQLVQAAMSGDELATQTIQLIMQAAQQGDQQAAQIAQMILEIAQLMQGQAQAAKQGAKLSYLRSLKSGCPEGTEAKYYKKGGRVCKECVKKACNGSKTMKAKNGADIEEEKCGGKAKRKYEIGGPATSTTTNTRPANWGTMTPEQRIAWRKKLDPNWGNFKKTPKEELDRRLEILKNYLKYSQKHNGSRPVAPLR